MSNVPPPRQPNQQIPLADPPTAIPLNLMWERLQESTRNDLRQRLSLMISAALASRVMPLSDKGDSHE
jgi:hypothetical protein